MKAAVKTVRFTLSEVFGNSTTLCGVITVHGRGQPNPQLLSEEARLTFPEAPFRLVIVTVVETDPFCWIVALGC